MKKQILRTIATVGLTFGLLASTTVIAQAGNGALGKQKAAVCAACHGAQGISAVPIYPNLAGQKETYLATQMRNFKTGTRSSPVCRPMMMAMSDADIANLATYYASLR